MIDRRKFKNIDPGPLTNVPAPPSHLDKIGKEAWETAARYLTERELLHSGDLNGLAAYSEAVSVLRRVSVELEEAPLLVDASHGPKQNPLIELHQKYNQIVRGWCQTLCLSPYSRQGMTKAQKAPAPTAKGSSWDGVVKMPTRKKLQRG